MEIEYRLEFCEECFQMTNHIGDECQKCKSKTKKININLDIDEDDEDIKNY